MKVSLNTIKQYIDFELPSTDELIKRINQQLGGVEKVTNLGKMYKDARIVRVVSCEKHPNADKLNVCEIDAGTGEFVQVVCGAPNVRADMFAVWLPPQSTVPATFDDKEPFVLEARELRGVVSNGMLASAKELGIGDSHDGILEINPDEWKPSDGGILPGTSFSKVFGLDDTIIDIENKMFTHRPDLFGQIGVAREIAGIFGQPFTSPQWYMNIPEFKIGSGLELEVFNDVPDKVARFMAVAIKDVTVKPSPLWLQCALVALGGKPINNIVDVTNYVMLLTAQPTHAYDYDKLRGHKLGARMARDGETATLLNGKNYSLDANDIVISDGEGAVGLAGVMGGAGSEVSVETKNIVLEVASFDMYAVRKSSMRHGVFTEALTRFNKGQSALQNDRVIQLLMNFDGMSGEQASDVVNLATNSHDDSGGLNITSAFINERLGTSLDDETIQRLLENVELTVEVDERGLRINQPFWRTDIEALEDIVEEVGRLYGFDKLPRELPKRSIIPAMANASRIVKQALRKNLVAAGANEVLTYSFVHEKLLRNVGQNPEHAFKLSNALSPDLQYYRLSITPSLLDKIQMNFRAGHDQFALFEIGKTHFKGEMDENEPSVPNEDTHIAAVLTYSDKTKPQGAAYFAAKQLLASVSDASGANLIPLEQFDLGTDEWGAQLTAPYEPSRSAVIVRDDQIWGVVGEFTQQVTEKFKLPSYSAGFESHIDAANVAKNHYQPLSKYPSVTQDISLKVSADTSYESVHEVVKESLDQSGHTITISLTPLAIYQSDDDISTKTFSFRIKAVSYNETLREADISVLLGAVEADAMTQFSAVRV